MIEWCGLKYCTCVHIQWIEVKCRQWQPNAHSTASAPTGRSSVLGSLDHLIYLCLSPNPYSPFTKDFIPYLLFYISTTTLMSTLSVSKTPREFHTQQFRVQTLNVKPLFNLIGDGMYYFCGPMKTLQWVMVWNILRHKSGFLYFMFRHYSLLPFWVCNSDWSTWTSTGTGHMYRLLLRMIWIDKTLVNNRRPWLRLAYCCLVRSMSY